MPRPASTTVMTNLQRGNIQAEAAPTTADLSWFTLAGRGDITAEQLEEMVAQGGFAFLETKKGFLKLFGFFVVFSNYLFTKLDTYFKNPCISVLETWY